MERTSRGFFVSIVREEAASLGRAHHDSPRQAKSASNRAAVSRAEIPSGLEERNRNEKQPHFLDQDNQATTQADLIKDHANADSVRQKQRAPSNLVTVLDLLTKLAVESKEISRIGISLNPGDRGYMDQTSTVSYSLGCGYTSNVIRHELQDDVGDYPRGSIVAIKKFIQRAPQTGQDQWSTAAQEFDVICQELRVSCLPSLKQHENIIHVLFVGWEAETVFPFLAMELAAHGSLEDVLTSPGFGPSRLQRCNLTIDIALGVAALHSSGIFHGDIKTANIMVQRHERREIVGKLTDFGGSMSIEAAQGSPTMGTELWWAPEVLFRRENIDWGKVDVYAFGLVIASIWARPSTYLAKSLSSACILDTLTAPQITSLSNQDRRKCLAILKSEPDTSPYSILAQSSTSDDLVDDILRTALSCEPAHRKDMSSIIKETVYKFSKAIDRDISALVDLASRSQSQSSHYHFKVWARSYTTSSREYLSLVFGRFLEQVKGSEVLLEGFNIEYTTEEGDIEDLSPDEFLDFIRVMLHSIMLKVLEHMPGDWVDFGPHLAFQTGISYLLKLGTPINEIEAAKWLAVACLGGFKLAVHLVPLIVPSCSGFEGIKAPWHLFLVLSALSGCKESMTMLHDRYPPYYRGTLKVIQRKVPEALGISGPYYIGDLTAYRNAKTVASSEMDLLQALNTLNAERVHFLLETGADASITDDRNVGVLHHLSLLEDKTAAGLASLCHKRGARLDLFATGNPPLASSLPFGSPLNWAFDRNMPQLFSELLTLHVQNCVPLKDHHVLFCKLASLDGAPMLSQLLAQKKETPWLFTEELIGDSFASNDADILDTLSTAMDPFDVPLVADMISKPIKWPEFQETLSMAIYDNGWSMISRRMRNGQQHQNYHEKTISLLIQEAADRLWAQDRSQSTLSPALAKVIKFDDITALRVIIRHHKASQRPLELLEQSLSMSIRHCSKDCFVCILDEFPQLIDRRVGKCIPMHSAAREKDPFFAMELLRRDTDLTIMMDRFSSLALSLVDGNAETAELIFQKYSPSEIETIFGPDQVTKFTMMGRLVIAWEKDRNPEIIESIRWLRSKGGAYFFAVPADKYPCWNMLLRHPSPQLQSLVIQDTAMLKVLFDLYPARLEECDAQMGLAPIHYAAVNGWLEVVITLLDRGVNVNLESSRPQAVRTAVFMAIGRAESGKPPDWTVPGGQLEIRRWRERVHEIVRVLIAAGAQIDSGSGAYQRRVLNLYSMPLASSMTIIRDDETRFVEDDDALRNLWPERLSEGPMDEEAIDNKTNMIIRNAVGDIIKVNRSHALETLDGLFRSSLGEVVLSDDFKAWFRAKAMSREQEYNMRAEVSPISAIELKWMSIIYPTALKAKRTEGEPEFDLTSLRQPLNFKYDNKNHDRQRYEADMELITRACSLDHRIYLGDGLYSSLDDVEKIENDNLALLSAAIKMSIEEAEDRKQRETHVEEDETGEVEYEMLEAAIAASLEEGPINVTKTSGEVRDEDEAEEQLLKRALAMSLQADEDAELPVVQMRRRLDGSAGLPNE